MSKNSRSRKWLLTINNPYKLGFTHDIINFQMMSFKWNYYCMCDETGEEGTYHTHLYFECDNAVSFSKIQKTFKGAHIDSALGSAKENRDYIRKEGKHSDSEKKSTNHIETFEEYGTLPQDTQDKNNGVFGDILTMIKDGCTISQIIERYPSQLTKISQLKQAYQEICFDKFKYENRDVYVEYIFGKSGTGKTTYVFDNFGFDDVYKVTNYQHPFDDYTGQDVMLLDEFHSSIELNNLLQYLDKFPCRLPARYSEKQACYTKVFILSNLPFDKQYIKEQINDPDSYNAFVRRINKITKFELSDKSEEFSTHTDIPVNIYKKADKYV